MKILFILFFSLLMGCDMNTSNNSQEKEFIHVTGLQFKLLGPYAKIQETDQGYIIYISPEDSRQADQILVQYRNEKPAHLEVVKEIDGQKIFYRESYDDGGSGGAETTLELWKQTGQGQGVYIEHYRQTEGRTDFAGTWAVIVGAR